MADPVISAKLIVLYRFMSHNFPRSKTMWFLANSSIWHTKMLLNLTIPHPTTCLNVFLWQFPSFSSCLEQRTVRNTRGPFLVLFSFMKEQVFVPKTPNIFAIIPDHLNSTVFWGGCIGKYCHHSEELTGNTGWPPERSDGGGQYCPSILRNDDSIYRYIRPRTNAFTLL